MLRHQMAFRWRADDGPLIALSPLINCKLDLDQKRRRNASIRINSLFVVTLHIDWYVSVNRSFSKRYNSLSSVGFKTLLMRRYSLHFANHRRDASLDRHLSLDMQIS